MWPLISSVRVLVRKKPTPAITSTVPAASAAVNGSQRMAIAMMTVAIGLMVPIMETACAPIRASGALIMNDGRTVDESGALRISPLRAKNLPPYAKFRATIRASVPPLKLKVSGAKPSAAKAAAISLALSRWLP